MFPDGWFRRAGRDQAIAAGREAAALEKASSGAALDSRFRSDMLALGRAAGAVKLGVSVADSALDVFLDPATLLGAGHALVLGRTGTGKTRLVAGVIGGLLALSAHSAHGATIVAVDYKGDLFELMHALIASLAQALPERLANALVDGLVVIDPFSTEALVPLNVLARDRAVPAAAEVQAFEVASTFERMTRAPTGVLQDQLLYHLILLGVADGTLALQDLAALVTDGAARGALAARSPCAEVREYFAASRPISAISASGLQARFGRLLRLPGTRAMLGARGCVDFRRLLGEKVVLVNLGNPPLGCEDIARFWGGLIMLKTTRAIFERGPEASARPVLLAVDEWQEGLSAAGEIAENYERVLAMARSKNVAALLMSQSLAGAAKVSSSLPKVVETNTSHKFLFSASAEDARAMEAILPLTGRLPRATSPWEERRGSPYERPHFERERLIEAATQLPDRQFFYWQRRAPYKAQLVRAINVEASWPEFLPSDRARALRVGRLAVPLSELEAGRGRGARGAAPAAAGAADDFEVLLGRSRFAKRGDP